MRIQRICFLLLLLLLNHAVKAQNYHAINGSSYAGSLAPGSNPASIVNVPYTWDVTLLGLQLKQATNAFTIKKYSLLSSPANAELFADNGTKRRFVFASQDLHLLNARINLGSRSAIAFGANLRSYVYNTTSRSNYQDSSYTLADFLKINVDHRPLSGELRGSAWAEVYATYAQTILEDGDHLLNAGLTLKVTRGLAGGYANAQNVRYTPTVITGRDSYILNEGSLRYGYSSNFDGIDSNKNFTDNRKAFLDKTFSSLGADIGFEYLKLSAAGDENSTGVGYETKIGLSVMDMGSNKYRYGSRSRLAIAGLAGVTDTLIENIMSDVANIDQFNDSLAKISQSLEVLGGEFFIYRPTRVVINVDQHIRHNFYINAEITVPVFQLAGKNTLAIKDLNLLAITPRWETQSWGIYFPLLLNTQHQAWIGGAIKAGPLLFGTHSLGNLFAKNKTQNGGLYLAFTIRPGKSHGRQDYTPGVKLPARVRRSLECPKF